VIAVKIPASIAVCTFAAASALSMLAPPARAETVALEQHIANIRLGQRVLVDDGSCPAGQIKEITGTNLTAQGVAIRRQCVERKTARR